MQKQHGRRCSSSSPCAAGDECVRLREDERILRLRFLGDGGREEVLLWSGPKVEVWEQGVFLLLV
jgi:S2P endopeptidase